MIDINYTPFEITVSGHANYADPGHDIVCAAVSTLVQTLDLSLNENRGRLSEYAAHKDNGWMHIRCVPRRRFKKITYELFDQVLLGLYAVAAQYPDYVKITDGV